MKVADLIYALQALPADAEVMMEVRPGIEWEVTGIELAYPYGISTYWHPEGRVKLLSSYAQRSRNMSGEEVGSGVGAEK